MKPRGGNFVLLAVNVAVFHLQETLRKIRIGINTNITPHAVRGNYLTDCKEIQSSHRMLLANGNDLVVFDQDFRSH